MTQTQQQFTVPEGGFIHHHHQHQQRRVLTQQDRRRSVVETTTGGGGCRRESGDSRTESVSVLTTSIDERVSLILSLKRVCCFNF